MTSKRKQSLMEYGSFTSKDLSGPVTSSKPSVEETQPVSKRKGLEALDDINPKDVSALQKTSNVVMAKDDYVKFDQAPKTDVVSSKKPIEQTTKKKRGRPRKSESKSVQKLEQITTETFDGVGGAYPIKLSKVIPFNGQPRKEFNYEKLEQLATSIQLDGQQMPIKVCKSDIPGTFVLVDGERRWRAHHIIQERTGKEPTILAFIDTTIKNINDHYRKSVIANLHRQDLTDLEEAASFTKLKDLKVSVPEICDITGRSSAYVYNYLKMDELPQEVKDLMSLERPKKQRLNTTAAIEIAKSTRNPEIQIELAYEAVDREMNISEVRFVIGNYQHGRRARAVDEDGNEMGKIHGSVYDGKLKRKPSEEYTIFTSFLKRTNKRLDQIDKSYDIDRLYYFRDDEKADRERDLNELRAMKIKLEKLMERVDQ